MFKNPNDKFLQFANTVFWSVDMTAIQIVGFGRQTEQWSANSKARVAMVQELCGEQVCSVVTRARQALP